MQKYQTTLKIQATTRCILVSNYRFCSAKAAILTNYHLAAYTQCADLIVFLLKYGSNPNLKVNVEGVLSNTALLGAYHQKQDRFQEAPDRSLHTLEKLEKQFTLDKPDFTAMLSETVKALLLYGASPYITNSTGCSSIMKATMNMDINNLTEMLKVAPSNDADINVCDESGFSALMTAVDIVSKNINKKEEPNIAVVKLLLLAKADPNAQYGDGDTVLMRVIKTCHVELLKTVLQCTQVDIQHQIKNIRKSFSNTIFNVALTFLLFFKKTRPCYRVVYRLLSKL